MKNSKSKIIRRIFVAILVVFSGLILLGIQGCKKYPEGDLINLESRIERVANTWKVDLCNINDVDYTSWYVTYSEIFTKAGSYSFQWGGNPGSGTWTFQNNDLEIRITGSGNMQSVTLFIMKLEETQFWYYYMDGNDKKVFHMVQQ